MSFWRASRSGFLVPSRRWKALSAALAISFCCGAGLAQAQSDAAIVRVEEDWELVVGTPDSNTCGPQLTCSIAPRAGDDSLYAALELNHRSLPDFQRGGMQLQAWSSDYNLSNNLFPQQAMMNTYGETVLWTMSMRLADGRVTFEVLNGTSTTWGSFGGQGYLRCTHETDLENLNGYSADESVENSGIGFASNRVQSLKLLRVRYFTSDGQMVVDDQERVVHQLQ